jgi:hypothetical protein
MARNPGALKRQKELARQQKQREKAEEREQRKKEKSERPADAGGTDPDIAGIVPGPQPRPDWVEQGPGPIEQIEETPT